MSVGVPVYVCACACVVRVCMVCVCLYGRVFVCVCSVLGYYVCLLIIISIYIYVLIVSRYMILKRAKKAEVYLSKRYLKTKLQLVFYNLRLRGESVLEEVGVCFKLQINNDNSIYTPSCLQTIIL